MSVSRQSLLVVLVFAGLFGDASAGMTTSKPGIADEMAFNGWDEPTMTLNRPLDASYSELGELQEDDKVFFYMGFFEDDSMGYYVMMKLTFVTNETDFWVGVGFNNEQPKMDEADLIMISVSGGDISTSTIYDKHGVGWLRPDDDEQNYDLAYVYKLTREVLCADCFRYEFYFVREEDTEDSDDVMFMEEHETYTLFAYRTGTDDITMKHSVRGGRPVVLVEEGDLHSGSYSRQSLVLQIVASIAAAAFLQGWQ